MSTNGKSAGPQPDDHVIVLFGATGDLARRKLLPGLLAEIYADQIDWHQVARLVQRGCPPQLALRIIR